MTSPRASAATFSGRPPGLLRDREPEHALAGVALPGLVQAVEPGPFQKALDGLIGGAHAGSAPFLRHFRLVLGQAVDHQGKPPRGDEAFGPREREPRRGQLLGHQAPEILGRTRLHPRRDLFREQLDQKFGHQARASPASHASQQDLAKARTRPI